MEEGRWNRAVDHSPRNLEIFAAAVWCLERSEGTWGLAERRLQLEGEAECMGFVTWDVSWEVA